MRTALRRYFRHGLFPQLMVFEAVARHASVTRAAEELHLAQPTVSTQLKKLSEALDLVLVEWRGREMKLTAAGEELYAACRDLRDFFERIDAGLAAHRQPQTAAPRSDVLRLAAVPGARQLASELLASYCAQRPGLQASLHVGEHSQLVERLAAGEDDLYLIADPQLQFPATERN